jgi:drug/metabolite transporter (DMT)-like permease
MTAKTNLITPEERSRGWLYANLYVVCIAVLSILYAIAAERGIHVLAFVVTSMVFAGVAIVARMGWDQRVTLIALAPLTWVIGASHLAMESSYYLMLASLPPTEAAIMIRLSVPVALLIGGLLFARWPLARAWAGAAVITGGVAMMVAGLNWQEQWAGILFGLGAATFVNIRAFASEFHPQNAAAKTVADKLRVTGVVLLVTALGFLAAIAFGNAIAPAGTLPATLQLPRLDDFMDVRMLMLALLVGAALFTAMTYLQFVAVVAIGTERFLATTVLIPVAIALLQYLSQAAGLIDAPAFNAALIPVVAIVVIGTGLVVSARRAQ